MVHFPHKTAIRRIKASFPCRYLFYRSLLKGRILDFGCGYGKDVEWLEQNNQDVTGYDPYYRPDYPQGKFDTILCTYVLNVVSINVRETIMSQIQELLKDNGIAYITVRRDITGPTITKKGTFQDLVKLDLPLIRLDSKCCIYEYRKSYITK